LPGVLELLHALKTTDGYWVGLLTGNIQEGARIKLGAFDLDRFFPLGAFGDDHEDRNQLLPIVLERFSKMTGLGLDYRDCVVIRDTPIDVACAKPYGARAIAVSTGSYDYESLL
jgi:phosphoglycolate phosphatase-like HAD superfamily hydrolase